MGFKVRRIGQFANIVIVIARSEATKQSRNASATAGLLRSARNDVIL